MALIVVRLPIDAQGKPEERYQEGDVISIFEDGESPGLAVEANVAQIFGFIFVSDATKSDLEFLLEGAWDPVVVDGVEDPKGIRRARRKKTTLIRTLNNPQRTRLADYTRGHTITLAQLQSFLEDKVL